ncbi:pyruvate kinase [Spiroplasma endosymbiont of Aspidapion aeneum]|uniref:pyruvate kinase n=1 Tax=Spiroplasma endosymbiont of Aspidapion aeneum TaxID=3066276 RepID=UPI00313DF81F
MRKFEFYEPAEIENKVKRTKVITTIGPSTSTKDDICKLFESGMNVIRLNFSHGSHEEHLPKINYVKELRNELKRPISIMLDTKGPEIRVGKFANGQIKVERGQHITIYTSHNEYINKECKAGEMTTSYDMSIDLKKGDTVLVDDGKLILKVKNIKKELIECEAFNSHIIKTNKRVNLPGVNFSLPFLDDKDKKDILFGIKQNVDYIAASFVNTHDNILEIRKILKENNGEGIQIISKIESQIGIQNIDKIIEVSDGVMVARGDLGLEIPFYEVPYWQKQIIRKCKAEGKIAIVATQMLESMTDNPSPTRAEITDVYYATELGADATMLSGESAAGSYPFLATSIMATINKRAELAFYGKIYYDRALSTAKSNIKGKRDEIACQLAEETRNGECEFAIVASRTGALLKSISKFRPNVTILGVCEDEKFYTKFGACHSIFMNNVDKIDTTFASDSELSKIAKFWGAKTNDLIYIARNDSLRKIKVK